MNEIIQVSHLKKYFKEVKAVDDVSFNVSRGELFGFLGVNGAGKTTSFYMIVGLVKPNSGAIYLDNLNSSLEAKICNTETCDGTIDLINGSYTRIIYE